MDNFIKTTMLKSGAIRDGRVGRRPMTIFCQDASANVDHEIKAVDVPSLMEISKILKS